MLKALSPVGKQYGMSGPWLWMAMRMSYCLQSPSRYSQRARLWKRTFFFLPLTSISFSSVGTATTVFTPMAAA